MNPIGKTNKHNYVLKKDKLNITNHNTVNNNVMKNIDLLFTEIEKSKSFQDFNKTINQYLKKNKEASFIDDSTIQHAEYFIKSGLELNSEYYQKIYPALKNQGIKMIPEFIKSAKTNEGFTLSLFKIKGADKGKLLDFDTGYKLLNEAEKQDAYYDTKKLLNLGIVNPEIFTKSLKITPDDKHHIICTNWENLIPTELYLDELNIKDKEILNSKFYVKFFR